MVILRSNIKTNGRDSSGGLEFRYLKIKGIEQAKKYFTEWEIREKDYSELILTEFLENPEVINMSEKDIENEKDESLKTTKKAIKQAKDTLEQISKDEHEQELARLRKKYIMDQNAIQKQRAEYLKKGLLVNEKIPQDYEIKIDSSESYEFAGQLHTRPDFLDIKEIEIYSGDTLILKCRKNQMPGACTICWAM